MKRVISILLIIASLLCFSSCGKSAAEIKVEDIRTICELATIKCYYNNVGQFEKKKDNIFQKDRKMWIEYEGEAIIGIDMSELKIEVKEDTVQMVMPKAKIISIKPNKETLNKDSYVVSADGWLIKNEISTEEQEEAIVNGQIEMEKMIKETPSLFVKAESRAKKLIENYIMKLSKIIEKEYKVVWE